MKLSIINTISQPFIHFAATSLFFRNVFHLNSSDPSGTDAPFHSLYDIVVNGGRVMYQTVAIACWILCFIAMVIAGLTLGMSSSSNDRFMKKSSVTRVAIIAAFLSGVVGFVNLAFSILA